MLGEQGCSQSIIFSARIPCWIPLLLGTGLRGHPWLHTSVTSAGAGAWSVAEDPQRGEKTWEKNDPKVTVRGNNTQSPRSWEAGV